MSNHIKDLIPDPRNARRHTPRNVGMVERSLGEVGAARSIVIDENNVILAGNATVEAAAAAGIERVQVIDADGETLIAVRRSGLTEEQKRKLALYDNRAAELADWDPAQIAADLEVGVDLSGLWSDAELTILVESANGNGQSWDDALDGLPNGDRAPFQQMTFTLHDEQAEQVTRALAAAKKAGDFTDSPNQNSNGNALAFICETFITEHGDGQG